MINWIISSSVLILAIVALRFLFKGKIGLRLQYALWLLVAMRLLVPINFGTSFLSIENVTNKVTEPLTIQMESEEPVTALLPERENAVKIYESVENKNFSPKVKETSSINWSRIGYALWFAGGAIVGCIFIVSNQIFAGKLKKSRKPIEVSYTELPVYVTKEIETPCLFGIFRPCIYVTPEIQKNQTALRHCIYHEMVHEKHQDLKWAVIRCICLALHWYNPLVWLAAVLSKKDAELACDEATILKLGEEERAEYGKTLIQLTCTKRQELFVAATTMTGGKNSLKERIVLIARKPKIKWYAILAVVLTSLIVVGCTFTNAAETEEIPESQETEPASEDTKVRESGSEEALYDIFSKSGTMAENVSAAEQINADIIIAKAADALRDGYIEAKLTYVDNVKVGWDYYSENPWRSDEERDALAQAALKELYTLTGYNVKECTYTTNGRSMFIFGKNAEYIRKCIAFYSRDYGLLYVGIPHRVWDL